MNPSHGPRGDRTVGTIAVALVLVGAQAQSPRPDGVTIDGATAKLHVSDARPLAEAFYHLSKAFDWRIGFEEAELRYPGDLVDMTSPKYVPKSRDDRAYDPRGGALDIQFPAPLENGRPADASPVVGALLAEYQRRGYPGRYSLSARDGYVHVFPEEAAGQRGVLKKAEPVTSVRVHVVLDKDQKLARTIDDALKEVGRLTGKRVLFGGINGMVSPQLFEPPPPQLAGDQSVFEFLDSAASALGVSCWEVLYDPTAKFYVVNLRR